MKLEDIVANMDSDEVCEYCIYNDGCSRGGGSPLFPPCAESDASIYFNLEMYLQCDNCEHLEACGGACPIKESE